MFNSIKTIKLWQALMVVVIMAAGGGASYVAYIQLITDDDAIDEDQQVIQVARGDLVQQVTTSGSLLYPNRYALGFQTQGTVGEVLVEEGQSVQEGQPLANLDAATLTTLETSVARARITLRDAQEALDALLDRSQEIDDAQEQVDAVTNSLGDARRSLQLAQMQWDTRLMDSGEALASAQDDYASPFRKYLNISITVEQTGEDSQSLLQSLGVDLDALFAPELRFRDVVRTATSEEFPLDDPATPWGEPVVYTWLNLFPGELFVTCNETVAPPQAVCITNEMDNAWESVQKSQASLDTDELEATNALNKSQNSVSNAENTLAGAQETLEELRQGPDSLDLDLAETEVSAAQAALDQALQGVEDAVIRAPVAGIVTVVNVEAGQEVTRNTLVVEVVDPTVVEMDGVVDEIDILQVSEGAAAQVTMDALPGSVIRGTVTSISDTANSQQGVVSYPIRIRIQNPGGIQLREGLSATANIIIQAEQNVLLVPVQALYGTFQEPTVRVVYEGGIEERSVRLGNSDDFWIVVVEGLSEGDEIVLEAQATSGASNLNIFRQFGGGFTGGGRGGFGGGSGGFGGGGGQQPTSATPSPRQ